MSVSLDASGRFAPDVIAIVSSGRGGRASSPESLQHLADDYEEQVDYMVKNMGQARPAALDGRAGGDRPVHRPWPSSCHTSPS